MAGYSLSPVALGTSKVLQAEYCVKRPDYDFSAALLQALRREEIDEGCEGAGSESAGSPFSSLPPSRSPSPLHLPVPPLSLSPAPSSSGDSSVKTQALSNFPPLPIPSEPMSQGKSASEGRKRRMKASSKRNRKKRRQQPKEVADIQPPENVAARFVEQNRALAGAFSLELDSPVASTSYVGLLDKEEAVETRAWRLAELVGPRAKELFTLVKAAPGRTVPISDSEGRVVALLVYPANESIKTASEEAACLLRDLRSEASFTSKQKHHRRGNFPQISAGVAHGGGRTRPANIVQNPDNAAVVDQLVGSSAFQKLSGFATGVFKAWVPRLYEYCGEHFEQLLASDSNLTRLFRNSVLPVAAFNFGPRTVCLPHIDFGNLPFNLCWIWSLGWFDWRRGGHLILWDLHVVVEFPPGSLAGIPSGVCRHSNTQIGKKETRYSFTQYAPGANFRWVDHGFQTEEDYLLSRSKAEAQAEKIRKQDRWAMGLGLFSTLEQLGLELASTQ
ncbi:hypothetical protein F5880DRAFT_1632520 [Lentinula raphanica]|nr:hypothetical protein F5880DRAFT_1632520 [Lentinula raphanica]